MRDKEKYIIDIAIICVCIAPFLLTRDFGLISFDNTGQIGDTIGGITAPIIGLLSIYLLYRTLNEQSDFNKSQAITAHNEQFKTSLFALLQEQREILKMIHGKFSYLDDRDVKHIVGEYLSGLDYFQSARTQITLIFEALDNDKYIGLYDERNAEYLEQTIHEEYMNSPFLSDGAPIEERNRILSEMKGMRLPMQLSYINDIYGIKEAEYTKYKSLTSIDDKIAYAYTIFYCKHEYIGHYFRHLYHIMKFIKKSEDEEVKMQGDLDTKEQEKNIREKYKQYAQFIQAQMSVGELAVMFYNSFVFKKMQPYIIDYGLLENLSIRQLVQKSHNCISEMKMKDTADLFERFNESNK